MLINSEETHELLSDDLTGLHKFLNISNPDEIELGSKKGFSNDPKLVTRYADKSLFIRCYTSNKPDHLQKQIDLIKHLRLSSFPVPFVCENKQNGSIYQGVLGNYIAYEYIDGTIVNTANGTTNKQLESMAKNLGRYHQIAKSYQPVNPQEPITDYLDEEELEKIAIGTLETLARKDQYDPIDELVAHALPQKIALINRVRQYPQINTAITSLPQVVTHGDYHGLNIIFNDADEVQGVIDWEDSGLWIRAAEVQAAIVMNSKAEDSEHFNVPIDFNRARIFLNAYESVYPLSPEERKLMPFIGLLDSLRIDFLLSNHYFLGRNMAEHMPNDPNYWFWWEKNMKKYAQEVLAISL